MLPRVGLGGRVFFSGLAGRQGFPGNSGTGAAGSYAGGVTGMMGGGLTDLGAGLDGLLTGPGLYALGLTGLGLLSTDAGLACQAGGAKGGGGGGGGT